MAVDPSAAAAAAAAAAAVWASPPPSPAAPTTARPATLSEAVAAATAAATAPPPPAAPPASPSSSGGAVAPGALMDRSRAAAHGFAVHLLGGGDGRCWWGVAATQGRRGGMEDAHAVDLDVGGGGAALFAVMDGHAGGEAAAFCARHIVRALVESPGFAAGDLERALSESYLSLEAMMRDPRHRHELACLSAGLKPGAAPAHGSAGELAGAYGHVADDGAYLGPQAGCTACVAVVRGGELFVANVGDSRCVLSEAGGRAVSLTRDHKPAIEGEQERVIKAGLSVARNRVVAAKSSLAMTRALGDTKYKDQTLPPERQAVTPIPETTQWLIGPAAGYSQLGGGDAAAAAGAGRRGAGAPGAAGDEGAAPAAEFMILACDGVWDCMSNEKAVSFVRARLRQGTTPQQAALQLVEECLDEGSGSVTPASADNITAMVVSFEPAPGRGGRGGGGGGGGRGRGAGAPAGAGGAGSEGSDA
ncbi:phosphatase 2C-like [Raphidocelis subcapitata]|uniref:Phosphatase 2C-like n=1 Tax=Raphidocelis subcapitata TaxID=307507 RepID=A0A2V0PDA6_9CHLO|nr:phosphatase 2C-like [Raphidocelis subcapitata]|eukprot:GBF97841.1 phosphatase 2C-like [Raphidocelis subcapitata]